MYRAGFEPFYPTIWPLFTNVSAVGGALPLLNIASIVKKRFLTPLNYCLTTFYTRR